ncbi:hypothetical protein N7532_008455 [Penicillium argentinense]|uniref:Enoyl reductase (ER) domain-containing protein n=1 Tax=Penicillium argentinense TaxID=1131581 RepID=A0A9W9EXN6_9EURO|nr:uncharacterized protein N7532_008455 [Penicillium argentinense]KAJ5089771.1 hypothetical protein N7532_008455 [Penicillium argentinense]
MKAIQILGDISSPRVATNYAMTKPTPQNAEILIRVHAAGITGDEVIWPEPYTRETRIPGHDISGVVSALGPDYNGPLKIGQEAFVLISTDRGEGQADYAICRADEVALKPKSISYEEAAALPIPLLTAWEALLDHGGIKAGMRVLITGASGAVGILAVQLAKKLFGVEVVALASSRNHEALQSVGADEVLDYNTIGWENQLDKVDLVFDTVGAGILEKAWTVVKENGAIVTVGDPAPAWAFGQGEAVEAASHPGVRYKHFIVSPNSERLGKAAEMVDQGVVRPLLVKEFPFEEAEQAWNYARQRARGHKVVISFA